MIAGDEEETVEEVRVSGEEGRMQHQPIFLKGYSRYRRDTMAYILSALMKCSCKWHQAVMGKLSRPRRLFAKDTRLAVRHRLTCGFNSLAISMEQSCDGDILTGAEMKCGRIFMTSRWMEGGKR